MTEPRRLRRYADLSIRLKLLAPFVVLLIVWGGFGSYVLARGSAGEARGRVTASLAEALDGSRAAFADLERQLLETVRLASHTEGVARAIAARDREELARVLLPIAVNADRPELEVVDRSGTVLVRVEMIDGKPKLGTSGGRAVAVVRRAARGESDERGDKWAGLRGSDLVVAGPVRDAANGVAGAVVVSEDVSSIARRIGGGTTAQVAVFALEGARLGSSAGATIPFRATDRGLRESVREGEPELEALYAPFEVRGERVGTIAVAIPSKAALGSVHRTAAMLALMVGLAVVAVVAIGLWTARAITRPVRSLMEATGALERGDLSARAAAATRDEVGTLAASFNKMAAELQASHEELERKVAERTAELEEVNQQLARASAAKSSFLASMSHELRTPLNAIIGFADMIRDPAFGPLRTGETRELGDNILVSGKHLLTLINDVLDLAKVEAGKIEIDLQPVDAAAVIGEVLTVVRPLADQKRLSMTVGGGLRVPRVHGDPARIRQVLFNLIANAIKFTPDGGRVSVTIQPAAAEVTISVTDTGPGLAAGEAERLFQPFERGRASRNVEGAGLGLALARHLVELQGGRIWATGRPGKGSAFSFTVPVAVGDEHAGGVVDAVPEKVTAHG